MPSKEKVRVPVVIVSDHICDQVKEAVAQWAADRGYKTQITSRQMRLFRGGSVSIMREIRLRCHKAGTRMEIEFLACIRAGRITTPVGHKGSVPAAQRGVLERTGSDRLQLLKHLKDVFPEAKVLERETSSAFRRISATTLVIAAAVFVAMAVIGWVVVQRWILR